MQAFIDVYPKLPTKRLRVMCEIQRGGIKGRTNEEISRNLGLSINSVTPRVNELVKLRLVADSGIHRKNKSGVKAIVWISTEHVS